MKGEYTFRVAKPESRMRFAVYAYNMQIAVCCTEDVAAMFAAALNKQTPEDKLVFDDREVSTLFDEA